MNSRNCFVLVLLVCAGFVLATSNLGAQCPPPSIPAEDCDNSGFLDSCEIANGTLEDCNLNGIPDVCEPVGEAILSPPGSAEDYGHAVSIDGDWAVVGDPSYEPAGPAHVGAAHIYRRVGVDWVFVQTLNPIVATANLEFGTSVSIRGDLVVVGAPGAGGVLNPNQGEVHVYRKSGGTFVLEQTLNANGVFGGVPNIPGNFDELGVSVAVDGDLILAGAWKNDNGGVGSGSVYGWRYDGPVNGWVGEVKLAPTVPVTNARFGQSVTTRNGFAAIGAPNDDQLTVSDAGAVYVYQRLGTTWTGSQKLAGVAPGANDKFGFSVAFSEDACRLLVGSPRSISQEGLAYVYDRTLTGTVYSMTLVANAGTNSNDQFGYAVGFAEEYMMVTAHLRSLGGNSNVGAAYIYDADGVALAAVPITGSLSTGGGSLFGFSGDASGKYAIVGAPGNNLAYVYLVVPFPDCNNNGEDDICEITSGTVEDCDLNGIPDSCDIASGDASDCNLNAIPDSCELADGSALDCNLNGVLDECDLVNGTPDCNLNGIPDDCELDCDENGVPDDCDLALGTHEDCNENNIPDVCDISFGFALDCNANGIPDSCDITSGFSEDCNANSTPDDCEITADPSLDCDLNGQLDDCEITADPSLDCNQNGELDSCDIASSLSDDCDGDGTPDECELSSGEDFDCNGNSILDSCDIASGTSQDCNANAIPDECDISGGNSLDCNTNGIPDECETDADPFPPTIVGAPGDMTLTAEAGTCQAVVSWTMPTAEDNCGVASFAGTHAPGSSFPVGTTTVTYTAIDVSGNQTVASFTVTITDDEAPTIDVQLPDLALDSEPGLCSAAADWTAPTAGDNCGVASLTSTHTAGEQFDVGMTTVTYTATDSSGNTATMSFTVTVTDIEDPVLAGVPAGIAQDNDAGLCSAVVTWDAPTATDNCPGVTMTSSHTSGDVFPVGTTTVTVTANDVNGNSAVSTFDVVVTDAELPTISGTPADMALTTDLGVCGAAASWTVTPADNCAIDTFVSSHNSGDVFPVGATTVTFTATDIHGNVATDSFTITVTDDELPVISGVPADMALDTDPGACGAIATWEASATDNCAVTLASSHNSGDEFPVGTTTVMLTATDENGNEATASFTITVTDNELPVIAPLANLDLTTDAGQCGAVAAFDLMVTDNCPGATIVADALSGDEFPVGVTTVNVTATDANGNESTASFTITVTDNELPVIAPLANLDLSTDPGQCGAIAEFTLEVNDNCPDATIVADALSGAEFPVGVTTVNVTATDVNGNESTASFTITVTDNELPVIAPLANLDLTTDLGQCGAIATFDLLVTDNCPDATIVADALSGDEFPVGVTTVNVTATDANGNEATSSFTITVTDNELPVIAPLANLDLTTDLGQCGAVATFDLLVTDNCPDATIVADALSGDEFPVGVTTVNVTATDVNGNEATASFTITVTDNELPVIAPLANLDLSTDPGQCGAIATFDLLVTDNCPDATIVADALSGDEFPVGVTTVNVTATDANGNEATSSFTITVTDNELPVIAPLANLDLTTDLGQCGAVATFDLLVTDNCPDATIVADALSGDEFPVGVTTVNVTATDAHGNESTASFTITVTDNELPVIAPLANLDLTTDLGQCGAIASFDLLVTDNCPDATIVADALSGAEFPVGVTTVNVTATDVNGNEATSSFTITVTDNELPVIAPLANLDLTTDLGQCGAVATFDLLVTDNCPDATIVADALSGDEFPVGTTTVNVTATDANGNESTASFTITVTDNELPAIAPLANLDLTTDLGQCGAIATFELDVTDNCPDATIVADALSGDEFPVGVTTVNVTATDANGNESTASFTITVTDNELPVIAPLANLDLTTDLGQCGAIATFELDVTDNCPDATIVADALSGDEFPVGVTTVNVTATDANGNESTASFTITVTDNELPVIAPLANLDLTTDLGQCGAIATFELDVTDNCPDATIVADALSGDEFPVGVTTVNVTATDANGNESTASFTITVTDNELPVIAPLADLDLTTDLGQCGAIAEFTLDVTDNCPDATIVADALSGDEFPVGVTTVNVTATDANGNESTASFTITVTDNELPVIAPLADLDLTTDLGQCGAIAEFALDVTDNCPDATIVADALSGDEFPVGTTTVNVTATDANGNESTASFTITVTDNELPVIAPLADLDLTTDLGQCGAVAEFTLDVTDNCPDATIVADATSGAEFPVGATLVTVTATDANGNVATDTFTITVTDNELPVIAPLADLDLTTDLGQCGAIATFELDVTDNCPDATIVADALSGDEFPVGTTTVNVTATDVNGNESTASFTITVTDNELPVIAPLADLDLTTDLGQCGAIATFELDVTDNCPDATIVADALSGDEFPVGTTTVNVLATDANGNESTASFTITVTDNELPEIGPLANIDLFTDEGECGAVATWELSVTDNCPDATIDADQLSGDLFPVGTTTVNVTATDIHGNVSTDSFTITVTDNEAPAIGPLANIDLFTDAGECGAVATWELSVTDNCPDATIDADQLSGDLFPVGTTTVNVTATDIHGNTSTDSFTITVTDNELPVILGTPADQNLDTDPGICGAVVTWEVSATDNCLVTLESSHESGTEFPEGTTTVTFTATDEHGNVSETSFAVTVTDNELPTIAGMPADILLTNEPGACGAVATWEAPTADDNCAIESFGSTHESGEFFDVGTTVVTYTAFDTNGNTVSAEFSVTVTDDEAPVIHNAPSSKALVNDEGVCGAIGTWDPLSATDNCEIESFTSTHDSGDLFPVGVTDVIYTAVDIHGNETTAMFQITVIDIEPPVIVFAPGDQTLSNDEGECGAIATWDEPRAGDNCELLSFTFDHMGGDFFPVGDTVVTYTATDIHSNVATHSFTITVLDEELPTIAGMPADLALTNDEGQCGAVATWTEPTAADNCAIDTFGADALSGDFFEVGTTVVTYTALDIHGNEFSASFSVTVTDDEAPAIVDLPADLLLENDADECGAIATWIEPGATDNCQVAGVDASAFPGDFFPVGTTTVDYLATDIHGNESMASFTVTVEDTQAPAIADLPADIELSNDLGECGAIATWTEPTSSDNCAIESLGADATSGDQFPVGVTTVTYTTTDIHGNSTTAAFTVTVLDTELPVIEGTPADMTLTNDAGECGAVATWAEPTSSDNCEIDSLTADAASGDFFEVGTTTVTYTTVDIHGNEASTSFTVTVTDDEAPAIADLPADILLTNDSGECGAIATWLEPTSSDNCEIDSLTADATSGDFFEVGTTTVTYTTVDIHGNETSASFTVTVTDDEVPAIAGLPADQLLTNDESSCGALFDWAPVTATDNCGIASLDFTTGLEGNQIPLGVEGGGLFFPVGTTTVLYTAIDIHGNESTASFLVTVEDTEEPAITDLPADLTLTNDAGECGAVATWTLPGAIDNCEVDSLTADAASGDFFEVGQTTVTYTATDIHGNSSTASFTVTVTDDEAPAIDALPADLTATNDAGACGAIVTWVAPTASDNCELEALTSDLQPGAFFEVGETTVTYTAVDIHGNESTGSFTVTVTDDELPTISGLPADLTLTNDEGECGAVVTWNAPTSADNCGIELLTSTFEPGDFFPVGTSTVLYTAFDIHGNGQTASFTITVIDDEAPMIVDLRDDMTVSNDTGECGAIATWAEPVALDNCETDQLTSSHSSGDFFPVGSTVVTYTLTDIHGNSSTDSFTVTVEDDELPTILGLSTDLVVATDPGLCTAVVTWTEVTAEDNCDVAQLTSDHDSGEAFPVGQTLVTYAATDIHGNATSLSFTITVLDQELPELTGTPSDMTLTNDAGECGAVALWTPPTGSDNCGIASMISSHDSGDFFPTGTTEVTYTLTDVNGNEVDAAFTVTVTDDEAPALASVPADMTIDAEIGACSAAVTWTAPTASDNCEVSDLLGTHASGQVFLLGTTEVSYTATDSSGNTTAESFLVTVIDTQVPTLANVPADMTLPNDSGVCGKLVAWAAPIATDNCEVDSVISSHQPGDLFPVGSTAVTYTAFDPSGNQVSATFTVTIEDTEAPAIMPSADLVLPAEDAVCFANVTVPAPAVGDNCGVASVTNDVTGTDDASAIYERGTTTITWTVTDIHGHVTTATQDVTITVDETDCNGNEIPDVCDLASGFSIDCNSNGIPDECEVDCNENGIPDDCDLANGTSIDTNGNAIPDECEPVFLRGDANDSGDVGFTDAIFLLQYLTGANVPPGCLDAADVNDDNTVNLADPIGLLRFLFLNEAGPASPFPGCGIDGDGISIGCEVYNSCP